MTEAEWLACSDPQQMLGFLRGKASDRKLRLFAVACCRRIWPHLARNSRKAVEAAERYTDGLIGPQELEQVGRRAALHYFSRNQRSSLAASAATWATRSEEDAASATASFAISLVSLLALDEAGLSFRPPNSGYGKGEKDRARRARRWVTRYNRTKDDASWLERQAQAGLLHDIAGNPCRPQPAIDPSVIAWHDSTVPRIAQGIDDERAYDRPPILADALLDAGCDDEELLAHCRSEGLHVRGCWAIDLILGKK